MADTSGVYLRPNGTVVLDTGLVAVTLRRPKLRELRHLLELVEERQAAEQAGGGTTADEAVAWVREVVRVLGDRPLSEDEGELPAWLTGAVPHLVIPHWQTTPKSPWHRLSVTEQAAAAMRPRPAGRLEGILGACEDLYRAAAEAQILPQQLDEMELWQITALFKDPDDPSGGRAPASGSDGSPQAPTGGRDLVAERIAAANAGLPEPEIDPPSPALLAAFGVVAPPPQGSL